LVKRLFGADSAIFSIDYYPGRLVETNPFETRSNVVNQLVQFSALACEMRKKLESASDEMRRVPMVIIAAEDDATIDTKTTVKLLTQDPFNSHIYLIPPTVDSSNNTQVITSSHENGDGLKISYTLWPHHGHAGITIRPGNPFINSQNFYCWYTPIDEMVKNKMLSPSSVNNSRQNIKAECVENLYHNWTVGNEFDADEKIFRPVENQHFDWMMDEIVHPFLNSTVGM
jgi:hypothetical protein